MADTYPPIGLLGSEQAYQGGLTSALNALQTGYDQARADLLKYGQQALSGLGGGGSAGGYMSVQPASVGAGSNNLQPYMESGEQALQVERALSGALGQEAFDQAYQESPYIRFLQEQGNRAVLAGAAATGGLGGGLVQQELMRYGQGLASQGLQQQIENIRNLSGMGYGAAGTSDQLATQRGIAQGNLNAQAAATNMQGRIAYANLASNLAQQLAGIGMNTASQAAGYGFGTGQELAAGRTRAGEQLAAQIAAASQNLAALSGQQGQLVSGAIGTGASNLAQLLGGQAQLGQQAAGQYAGLPSVPGIQWSNGIIGNLANAAQGIGTAAGV